MVAPTTKRNAIYSQGVHIKMFLIVGSYLLGKLSQVKSSQSTQTPMHRTKTTPSTSTTTTLTTTTSSTTSKKLLKECGALSLFTLLESSSQLQWKDRKMSKLNKKSSPPLLPTLSLWTDLDLFLIATAFFIWERLYGRKREKVLWYFKAILTRMKRGPFRAVIFHDCTLWQSSNKTKRLRNKLEFQSCGGLRQNKLDTWLEMLLLFLINFYMN